MRYKKTFNVKQLFDLIRFLTRHMTQISIMLANSAKIIISGIT